MKKITKSIAILFIALTTLCCNKDDEPTPNGGGADTTTTAPADTTATTPQDTTVVEPSDTTVIEPTDTTTTEPTDTTTVPTDTTVVEPSDTTTVLEPDTRPEHIVSEDEADYYTAPKSFRKTINIVEDYSVDNKFETDDSNLIKAAVSEVVNAGGGKIIIPAGNYTFSGIELQSNVHFEIDEGAVIRPAQQANETKSYTIFSNKIATETPFENISVVGVNGMFTIDLSYVNNKNVRSLHFTNIKNFMIANINIIDSETTFSSIEFTGKNIGGKVYGPSHGVIKNIHVENTVYGYGLMQMQYGTDMLFKDLYCEGGINLRFESHLPTYFGTDCKNYITRIVCRRITCEHGHAAVAIVPHFVFNGWIDARDIYSYGCETAVTISEGYTNDAEAAAGHKPGYFSSETTFRNIYATSTNTEAQVNPSNFKYMVPQKQHLLPSNNPWEPKPGPSIQIVLYAGLYKVDIADRDIIQATDFLESQRWYYAPGAGTQIVPTLAD